MTHCPGGDPDLTPKQAIALGIVTFVAGLLYCAAVAIAWGL